MDAHVTLSVIIPCYNGMPYVLEAVRSVLDHADGPVEVIVVDDGSTDGSGDAVARAFGDRVRVVRQANAGVAAARNRGLTEATGELVLWLDADDRLLPDTLSLRRRRFAEVPGLEMLVGVNQVVDVDTGVCTCSPRAYGPDWLVNGLLHGHETSPHLNAMTFRRRALARVGGFDPALRTCEDLDFWMRAWAMLRWEFVDVVLSWQRRGNYCHLLRRTVPLRLYEDRARVLKKNCSLLREAAGSDGPWRREYAHQAALNAALCLEAGRRCQAALWSLRAIGAGPRYVPAWKYLLESVISPPVYRVAVWAIRRLGNRSVPAFANQARGAGQ